MKILHLIDSGGLYGAEIMLLHLAAAQMQMGVSVTIGSLGKRDELKKALEQAAEDQGIPLQRFNSGCLLTSIPNKVVEFVGQSATSLIHTHGYKPNILLGLIGHTNMPVPLVATLHGWTGGKIIFDRMRIYRYLNNLALRQFSSVVHVSHASMKASHIQGNVIWNGIPPETPRATASFRAPMENSACPARRTIAYVGRLSPEKGVNEFIDAVGQINLHNYPISALVVGDGPMLSTLKKKVQDMGLSETVHFLGYVENFTSRCKSNTILVIPSYSEGMPIVLLEGMRSRLPVIATEVGGIPEVTKLDQLARIVPPADARALAREIEWILLNPTQAEEMTQRAHSFFLSRLSSQFMAAEYLKIYESII